MTVKAPEPAAPTAFKEPTKAKKGAEKEEEELVNMDCGKISHFVLERGGCPTKE